MNRRILYQSLVLGLAFGLAVMLGGCTKKLPASAEIETDTRPPSTTPPPAVDTTPHTPPSTSEDGAWKSQVQDVFFDFDKYELRSEARQLLQDNARLLKEYSGASVVMEGHCDERGTEEYNLALGQRRADAARSYLIDLGVAGSRLNTVSYGEERPFTMGHDEKAWNQNRRVHFKLN